MRLRFWLALLIGVGVLVSAVPARAERIITTPDVMNRVKLRHRPTLDSPAIGSLRFNESAELLESLPYWYHIKLDNGVPGYVSRGYTRKLSEAEADGEIIRVGFWNIRKLGRNPSADYKLIARVVEANFDALALAGIMQDEALGRPGYDALLKALGSSWAGLITTSPRPEAAGLDAEFYAILYRTAIIRPCSEWGGLVYYDDSGANAEGPGPDHFRREPAFACFEAPTNKSRMGIDFLLGVYSAPEQDAARKEADQLDVALAAMQALRSGQRDIILAGTFNLTAAALQDVIEARVRTKGAGSTLDPSGRLSASVHDHIIVLDEEATTEMVDDPQVIDARSVAGSNLEFYEKCSDHLPVILRLRTTGPDDDL